MEFEYEVLHFSWVKITQKVRIDKFQISSSSSSNRSTSNFPEVCFELRLKTATKSRERDAYDFAEVAYDYEESSTETKEFSIHLSNPSRDGQVQDVINAIISHLIIEDEQGYLADELYLLTNKRISDALEQGDRIAITADILVLTKELYTTLLTHIDEDDDMDEEDVELEAADDDLEKEDVDLEAADDDLEEEDVDLEATNPPSQEYMINEGSHVQ